MQHWAPPDRVDGRVVLVTGATSGIGRAIADGLAGLGAVVIVVGRDESRGHSTVKAIVERTDNPEVSFERADLSRLADVRDLADRVAHDHTRLDVLIHNAGALSRDYVRTEDGLELTVAVHVVAPFLLTHLLMGQLTRALMAASSRCRRAGCTRSVSTSPRSTLTPRSTTASRPTRRAKRAQVELTRLWDLHYGGSGLRFVAMHPGWVATAGLDSGLPRFARLAERQCCGRPNRERTPPCGSRRRRAPPSSEGRFWLDRRPRREHLVPWTHSPSAEPDRLWEWCVANAGLQA